MKHVFTFLCILGIAAPAFAARMTAEEAFPEDVDPFMGEYVGRWSEFETINPEIAAQVYPVGRGDYHVRIVNKLDMRCAPIFDGEVEPADGKLEFEDGLFFGVIENGMITGGRGKSGRATFSMVKVQRTPAGLGKVPPEGAIVLFGGRSMDQWTGQDDWVITDEGYLMVTPDAGYLVSKQKFKDVQIHVEFRTPLMPRAKGQQRGNSGVFLQTDYEVQILDSFGLDGYYNDCGALYKVAAPYVNACLPPLQWQTYDITFHAAKYEGDELVAYPRITVYHNDVLIHNDLEMKWRTAWKEDERLSPHPKDPGHIRLQGHDNYVQFRNIWVKEL